MNTHAQSQAGLVLEGVRAGYGDTVVLEDISLTLQPSATLSVLGRNGVGKTTLLATIMGRTSLHGGSLRFGGRTIGALLHLNFHDKGALTGRVLTEAMPGGAMPDVKGWAVASEPAENGVRTVLEIQAVGATRYWSRSTRRNPVWWPGTTCRDCPCARAAATADRASRIHRLEPASSGHAAQNYGR